MIKIFTKERKQLTTDLPTWIVKWKTYRYKYSDGTFPNIQECYQVFTDEAEAREFADAINKAMALIQMDALPDAKVYQQARGGIN